MDYNVCFIDGIRSQKFSAFLARDTNLCKLTNGRQDCPQPLDLDGLSEHCKNSPIIAMKVIYVCHLKWLVPLMKNNSLDVKVVHLVRDPRATLVSRSPDPNRPTENVR